MPSIQRRAFLGTLATTSALAGCVEFGGSPATIDLVVTNEDDASHTVDVNVEFAGETLLEERFAVDSDGERTTTFPNPEEGGEATVSAAVAGGASARRGIRAGAGTGLSSVSVTVGEAGSVVLGATVR